MPAALVTAPAPARVDDDDSDIIAVMVERRGRTRTWVSAVVSGDARVTDWREHALDNGEHIAIMTANDLAAIPPN